MTNEEKTSDVLDTAATLIEINGWTRRAWGNYGRPMCLEGGIMAAMGVEPAENRWDGQDAQPIRNCDAFNAVRNHLRETNQIPSNELYINVWNDEIASGENDVVETLRTVAAKEREAGR